VIDGLTGERCCEQVLERFTEPPTIDDCKLALSEHNATKNRFSTLHLLSRDVDHVTLPGVPTVSNYINAVYVDSYSQRQRFIVTQTPLVNTVDDFWAMIRHQQVRCAAQLSSHYDLIIISSSCHMISDGIICCWSLKRPKQHHNKRLNIIEGNYFDVPKILRDH